MDINLNILEFNQSTDKNLKLEEYSIIIDDQELNLNKLIKSKKKIQLKNIKKEKSIISIRKNTSNQELEESSENSESESEEESDEKIIIEPERNKSIITEKTYKKNNKINLSEEENNMDFDDDSSGEDEMNLILNIKKQKQKHKIEFTLLNYMWLFNPGGFSGGAGQHNQEGC